MPFDPYNNEYTDSSLYFDDFGDGDDRMEILRELDENYDPMSDPDPFDDNEEWSEEDDDRGSVREEEDENYDDLDDDDLDDEEHEDLPYEDDDDIDDCFNCDGSISDKGFALLGHMDRKGLFV
ncbi:MAG: hypothetical protein FJ267_12390 [Planctomycetes bacterium]|nr:hypothetical protein [Planctomycetota bacterium]